MVVPVMMCVIRLSTGSNIPSSEPSSEPNCWWTVLLANYTKQQGDGIMINVYDQSLSLFLVSYVECQKSHQLFQQIRHCLQETASDVSA